MRLHTHTDSGMFAVTATTAPCVVAAAGARGTKGGVSVVRGVGGASIANQSRVSLGGARRGGDALRMVRTAATEGEKSTRPPVATAD